MGINAGFSTSSGETGWSRYNTALPLSYLLAISKCFRPDNHIFRINYKPWYFTSAKETELPELLPMLILPPCHAEGDGALCAQGSGRQSWTMSPRGVQTWRRNGRMVPPRGDELSPVIPSSHLSCLLVKKCFYAHQEHSVLDSVISGLVQALLCLEGQTVRHFL